MNPYNLNNVTNQPHKLPGLVNFSELRAENKMHLAYLESKLTECRKHEQQYAQTAQEKQASLAYERQLKQRSRY